MVYPVFVKNDEHGNFCVEAPDLMGCFTDGDALDEALERAEEAVECAVMGYLADDEAVPEGSLVVDHMDDYGGGTWAYVTVDLDALRDEFEDLMADAEAYRAGVR